MLTIEELQRATINPAVAAEAFDKACKRLADILEAKKSLEQKAFALFSGYLTIAVGLFGAATALLNAKEPARLLLPFWAGGSLFMVGTLFLLLALLDAAYGAQGSDPEIWIRQGVIDGGETALPHMRAYLTLLYQDRIDISAAANERKAKRIRVGVIVGFVAPIVAVLLLLAGRS
ncbi:MAG TPA: hypothetical protein VGS12_09390 [Caulobacteraceae bacterium]|nr:hypothetical protein [Caulobacteraceae bacterium]